MMSMDIDPRTPHVSLMNTEQLLGGEKTSFHYWPGIFCMCLLRGLNRHIRVIYATDHISPCTTASEHPFGTTHVK